jgi:hypothetical protein
MATTNYPGSIDAYPVPNNGDTISVADHWLGPAVIGIETELGTDPAGSFTDVKSRLDDVDDKTITEIDQWQITADLSGVTGVGTFTTNWARSSTLFSNKGTGLQEGAGGDPAGVFSFPSTGYYRIIYKAYIFTTGGSAVYAGIILKYSTDSFSSVDNDLSLGYNNSYTTGSYAHVTLDAILRISDIANQKIKFNYQSQSAATYSGSPTIHLTGFTCVKIGEL